MTLDISLNAIRLQCPTDSLEAVTFGTPIEKGLLTNSEVLGIFDQNNRLIPCFIAVSAFWPDQSISWLTITALLDHKINDGDILKLKPKASSSDTEPSITLQKNLNNLSANTGAATFHFSQQQLLPHKITGSNQETELNQTISLIDENGKTLTATIDKLETLHTDSAITAIKAEGFFCQPERNDQIHFQSEINLHLNSQTLIWDFTLHNPQAANHPGGFWDLGDNGSFFFKELSFAINPGTINQASIQVSADTPWQQFGPAQAKLSLKQIASGGKNWQSRNHLNHKGEIPLTQNGYQLQIGKEYTRGNRASPTIQCQSGSSSINCHIKDFWQNFPTEILIDQQSCKLALFPSQKHQSYELQGGEKKTHRIYLDFSDNAEALNWCRKPSQLIVNREHYATSQLFPHLAGTTSNTKLQNLIDQGINGNNSFFNKREKIDEYGWRHFGELYADHETLYQKPEATPLSSHYNNQYDPIYGFARQYIETGDHSWFELMDDLAKHVLDIDIYHTNLDRGEYNHGLFWHTDHYLDAGTCSHRTFSRQHLEIDHVAQSGGGPGTEHCYTTGLRYYYYLTGNQNARDAVLKLNQWMEYAQEGTGSVLERIQSIRTKDIPTLKKLKQGSRLYDHRYQLTRGTGNYINVLLDSYYLTQNSAHIERVEDIIKQTVHPNDDMTHRHFDDIELTWSYTIFLQAVCKYLHYKISTQALDSNYLYARDSLLHYAAWMENHERPYLHQEEALEYPNHTWAAQDIRKAQVLMEAYYFSPKHMPELREKSLEFVNYVTETLKREPTRTYTRILVILMQNQMDFEQVSQLIDQQPKAGIAVGNYSEPPLLSKKKVIGKAAKDLIKAASKLSISREKKWLKSRLS